MRNEFARGRILCSKTIYRPYLKTTIRPYIYVRYIWRVVSGYVCHPCVTVPDTMRDDTCLAYLLFPSLFLRVLYYASTTVILRYAQRNKRKVSLVYVRSIRRMRIEGGIFICLMWFYVSFLLFVICMLTVHCMTFGDLLQAKEMYGFACAFLDRCNVSLWIFKSGKYQIIK